MQRLMEKTQVIVPNTEVHEGYLVLVNKNHPIRRAINTNTLVEIATDMFLEKRTAVVLNSVLRQVNSNEKIIPVSGYRSRKEQEDIFRETMLERGEAYTRTYVALPDCSEHQTGLAVDMGRKDSNNLDFIAPAFPYTGSCQMFRQIGVQYGFIERYPKGKEAITGIGHEPWHFRYVGAPHAALITGLNYTLEEYIQWIKNYLLHENPYSYAVGKQHYKIGYVPAKAGQYTSINLEGSPYTISGNNVDGFIVTIWNTDYDT